MKKNSLFIKLSLALIIAFTCQTAKAQMATDTLDIFDLSFEELLNIEVVSASKKKEKLSAAPAIMHVITQEDIREGNFTSLAEAIRTVPGFYVSPNHVTNNLGVRAVLGGRQSAGRTIKIMIDGQPVSFRSTSENLTNSEFIPMQLVQRIEVISGPASTLYGANAFLGVINVITKNGDHIKGGNIAYSIGNLNNGRIEASAGFSNEKVDFTMGVMGEELDRSGLKLFSNYDNIKNRLDTIMPSGNSPFDYESINDIAKPKSAYGKLTLKENFGSFTTSFNYQEIHSGGRFYSMIPVINQTQINRNNWYLKEAYSGSFLDDNLIVNASVAYASGKNLSGYLIDDGDIGNPVSVDMGYESIDVMGEVQYTLSDRFTFMVSIDHTDDKHDLMSYTKFIKTTRAIDTIAYTKTNKNIFSNTGVNARAIVNIIEGLNINFGARLDNNNIYNQVVSYKVGAVYNNKKLFAKLLYGTSFRAPTANQLFTSDVPYDYLSAIGNPNLEPEDAQTAELNFGISPLENLSLSITGFHTIADKLVMIDKDILGTGYFMPFNFFKLSTTGVEFTGKFRTNNFSLVTNLSYNYSETPEDDLDPHVAGMTFPEFSGNVKISYTHKHFTASLFAYHTGEVTASRINRGEAWPRPDVIPTDPPSGDEKPPIPDAYFLDAYTLFDFVITSKDLEISKTSASFSLAIKNMLDTRHNFPGFFAYDVPGLGRNLLLTTKIKF